VVTPPVVNRVTVGGYSSIDVQNLSSSQKKIDDFVRQNHPELSDAVLQSGQTQLVAGQNFRYVYADKSNASQTYRATVYRDLKNNL